MVVSLFLIFIEFYFRLLLGLLLLGIYSNLTSRNFIQQVVIVFHLVQILSAIELGFSRIFVAKTEQFQSLNIKNFYFPRLAHFISFIQIFLASLGFFLLSA